MQLRIFTICICTFLALNIFTFTSFSAGIEIIKPHERLAGTWANDFFEATFDWKNGIYSGKVFDKTFSQPLILIKEYDNILIFTTEKSDKSGIKVEIINDNQIKLDDQSSPPRTPLTLKRKEVNSEKAKLNKINIDRKIFPSFDSVLEGKNEVRVKNPNNFMVVVGLRSKTKGKDFEVQTNGVSSAFVPDGKYDIYFVYSSRPDALFQGDSFTLNNNGVEIQIVKVVAGNYGIRQVK